MCLREGRFSKRLNTYMYKYLVNGNTYIHINILTHINTQKKEKTTPLLPQLIVLDPNEFLLSELVFLHSSAVYTNATNHMKAHNPLIPVSTSMITFFNCMAERNESEQHIAFNFFTGGGEEKSSLYDFFSNLE